jgi:serine/threonine protein kinase
MTEREIFLAVLEKDDPTQRATYLDQACGADATLRHRVEALLRAHERAPTFMEVPVVEQLAGGEGLDFLAPSQKPGSLGCLAHYEVLEVVGRGGMGVVFRAFDTKLHRVVAIKALAPQLATSSAARQRFVREARAAAAVTHDNVIDIHTVEDAGPVPYLVMQFIDGPTLQKKLDRTGLLSLKEILRIGLQIAEGLAAAHRQGLIHRDVKPANILLENGVERVKITDFGLARAADDASLTHSGMVAGTPMYMSPEQADGLPVGFRSDLFSLGSVLYAMCTGRPPFRAPTPMAVLKRVCEETPRPIREINPELPPWLEELVVRLHAKAPADRFASAREVADLLARHLAELQHGGTPPATVQPPSAKQPAQQPALAPPRRPHRRWLMAAAVLLVPLAGLGLGEATGITNVRGTVLRLFSPEGTPAPTPAQALPADAAAWEQAVAALPAEEQVKAVAARLKELNPGFDGKVTPTIADGVVTRLRFSTDQVTNLAPVRALARLELLDVSGTEGTVRVRDREAFVEVAGTQGKLIDLSPLKGMSLSVLNCSRTRVSDLSPLKGMPLTWLGCALTDVSDLTPLIGLPLRQLLCGGCSHVKDLTPLKGMLLSALDIGGTGVADLSPLRGMPLRELNLHSATRVTDLSALKGMPLELLNLGHLPVTDLSPLKDMTALHTLIFNDTPVADLSVLKGLPLKSLRMSRTKVSDLSPLQGLPLKQLWIDYQPERDAEVLRSLTGLEQINDMPAAEFWKAHGK